MNEFSPSRCSGMPRMVCFSGCRDMDLPEIVDPGAFKETFFETRASIFTRLCESRFRTEVHVIGTGSE